MLAKLIKWPSFFIDCIKRVNRNYIKNIYYTSRLGFCGKNVMIWSPNAYTSLSNMYMHDNTNLYEGFNFISMTGKFIMKRNSGAAQGLTIVTGNHQRKIGSFFKDISIESNIDKDIMVEEDVWLGTNVTLLSGVTIGRGATVGASSVCTKNVPPYSIVMGNPAKVIAFNYTPEEIIAHEQHLYEESERLSIDLLNKNYEKYYLNRIHEIKKLLK